MSKRIKYTAARNPDYLESSPVRAVGWAVYDRAWHLILDDSVMEDDGAYSGSAGILTKPIAREVNSWIETPEARGKTLRNIMICTAVQASLM